MPLLEGTGYEEPTDEPGPPTDQPWHRVFAESDRIEEMRALGQRVSGVFVQYVMRGDVDARLRADARDLGRQYATTSLAAGADLLTATTAFLYFKASLADIAAPTVGADSSTFMKSCVRYEEAAGEVLLGLIEEYQGNS